jgi:hypothetical protein
MDFQRWAPKDFLAHSAEWTQRRIALLRDPTSIKTVEESGGLGSLNQELFRRHQDTPWVDVLKMLRGGVETLLGRVGEMEEAQLLEKDPSSQHGIWRGIAFYGIVHSIIHMVQALFRVGNSEAALALQSRMTPILLEIEASDPWQSVVTYNHARALVLAGKDEALDCLRQALALNPDVERWVSRDPDFAPIRDSLDASD